MINIISNDDSTEKKYVIKKKLFDEVHGIFMGLCPLLEHVAKNYDISPKGSQHSPYACLASYSLASEANLAIDNARKDGVSEEHANQMLSAVVSCVSSRLSGEKCQNIANKIQIYYNEKRKEMKE